MAQLGGFLAVVYVSERGVRNMLDGAWVEFQEDRFPAVAWSAPTPVGPAEVTGAASIGKPEVSLLAAGDVAHVELQVAARVDVSVAGVRVGTAVTISDVAADLMLVGTQAGLIDVLTVRLGPFAIGAHQTRLTWLEPPAVPVPVEALINAVTLAELTAQVRPRLEHLLEARMPSWRVHVPTVMIPTSFGPTAVSLPHPVVSATRVLPGWLAIGVDDRGRSDWHTHGDPALIGLPGGVAAEETVVLVVDAGRAAAYCQANVQTSLLFAAAEHTSLHPHRESVRVELGAGALLVHAGGTVNRPDPFPGSARFSATVRCTLAVDYVEKLPYLVASADPDIHVDTEWWEDVLATVVWLFDPGIFEDYEKAGRKRVGRFGPVLVRAFPVETGVRRVSIAPDAIRVFGWVRGVSLVPPIGVDPVASFEPVGIRERRLTLRLRRNDVPLLEHDPTYLLRYEVHAGSDGRVVATGQTWSGRAELTTTPLDMWRLDTEYETSYDVVVRAERPPGVEVRRSTATVPVIDLFDRSHPYARWARFHRYLGETGWQVTTRVSVVHKTALAERCAFGDAGWQRKRHYTVQALDARPEPVEGERRSLPCPYCFAD